MAPRESNGPRVYQSGPVIENVAQSRAAWPEPTIHPDGDPLPLLEEGAIVDAIVVDCRLGTIFKGEQTIELRCLVLDDGGMPKIITTTDGHEVRVELPCYFRLPSQKGDGRTLAPRRGKFYRAWTLANGGRRPSRRDRMKLAVFKGKVFRARIRVVKTDSRGNKAPKEDWYSIIDELIP